MQTSIVIPSLNSPIIHLVIDALMNQIDNHNIGEILIVGKDELELIQKTNKVRLIDTGHPVSASCARNIGIAQTQYDLLLFLDSDCIPVPTWLQEHQHAHEAGHRVVGGGVLPSGDNYWSLSYNITLFHEFLSTIPPGPRDYLPTLNLSVHRDVIDEVGQLDEELSRGQDIDWTARMNKAGYQPFFWPQAAVRHAHSRETLHKVWKDCARSGFYMRQIRLQNQDVLESPGWLKNRAFILGFSPLIATGVTGRIVKDNPNILKHYWQTLPAIYMTKLAWCWGAAHKSYDGRS